MNKQNKIKSQWISIYLFFNSSPEEAPIKGDKLILQYVKPFIERCKEERWIIRYFFIRYSDNKEGYHIRLRMYGKTNILTNEVKPALYNDLDLKFTDTIIKSPHNSLISHARWVPYRPEINRYGGPFAIKIAEKFFHASSDLAISVLNQIDATNLNSRLGKALITAIVFFHIMSKNSDQYILLARNYTQTYLESHKLNVTYWNQCFKKALNKNKETDNFKKIINQLHSALKTNNLLPNPYNSFRSRCKKIRKELEIQLKNKNIISNSNTAKYLDTWDDLFQVLMPSYIHMTNNRIGLSKVQEAYLTYLIYNLTFYKSKI